MTREEVIKGLIPLKDWVLIELGPKWLEYLGKSNEEADLIEIPQHPMIQNLRVGKVIRIGKGIIQANGNVVFPCPELEEGDLVLYNDSGAMNVVMLFEGLEKDIILIRATDLIAILPKKKKNKDIS